MDGRLCEEFTVGDAYTSSWWYISESDHSLGLFSRSGWIDGTGLAMLGAEELEFTNPVSVGDEIRTRVEVADTSPTSSDRGGVVVLDWEVQTQDEDVVLEMTSSHFIKKGE